MMHVIHLFSSTNKGNDFTNIEYNIDYLLKVFSFREIYVYVCSWAYIIPYDLVSYSQYCLW